MVDDQQGGLQAAAGHKKPAQRVLILDYGSQYTQLIARRIRQLHVYCEIWPWNASNEAITGFAPRAIVLSGGPQSVYAEGAPTLREAVLEANVPVLGICFGLQLLVRALGGEVAPSDTREYGHASVEPIAGALPAHAEGLWDGMLESKQAAGFEVWMSHGDHVAALPQELVCVASTNNAPFAAVAHTSRPILGLQFHPEVHHTPKGIELIRYFVLSMAQMDASWTMDSFIDTQVAALQKKVAPGEHVICALSGGVDSSVVAAILAKAIKSQVVCIFVNNGLVRSGETEDVRRVFEEQFGLPLRVVDAEDRFLTALAGVTDPERKRKIIGGLFIEIFEAEALGIPDARFLAQGTLYPDVIESVSVTGGPSATIKSHHNVGGLPERMNFKLVEPLRELFKDEVRSLGIALGLPEHICYRQPFPGPGLAIRIVGEVTRERLAKLRKADAIVLEEIAAAGLERSCWQSFAVLLPVRSVGVMGDGRTYEETIAIRSVDSVDGMTADWSRLPYDLLAKMSSRIVGEVVGINRVVYDISSKPPGTIEWE